MTMPTILGIDWGGKRIGIARADTVARLAEPLETLANDADTLERIGALAREQDAEAVVVGIPRNLSGEETAQSKQVREFANDLARKLQCKVMTQDETLSSRQADALQHSYPHTGRDARAAAVILHDYLEQS